MRSEPNRSADRRNSKVAPVATPHHRDTYSIQATHELEYCLDSLRFPMPPSSSSPPPEPVSYLEARQAGLLYDANAMPRVVRHLTSVIDHAHGEDGTVDPHQVYSAAIVMDTFLVRWKALRTDPTGATLSTKDPLCSVFRANLPDYFSCINDVLFSPDPILSSSQHHVMGKLLPRAGMPRRFINILRRCAKDAFFKREISEIIMCGLLGNYRHCTPRSRADLNMRTVLYEAYRPRVMGVSSPTATHQALAGVLALEKLPDLPLFVLREYMCALIDESSVMRRYASALFSYDTFRATVNDVMDRVRVYIRENLTHSTGTLSPTNAANGKWEEHLKAQLVVAYNLVVKHAYRKPRLAPLAQLRSAKGVLPPTLAWTALVSAGVWFCSPPTSDEKCSATRTLSRLRKSALATSTTPVSALALLRQEEAKALQATLTRENADAMFDRMEKLVFLDHETAAELDGLMSVGRSSPAASSPSPHMKEEDEEEEEGDDGGIESEEEEGGGGGEEEEDGGQDAGQDDEEEEVAVDGRSETDGAYSTAKATKQSSVQPPCTIALTRGCIRMEHSRLLQRYLETLHPDTSASVVFAGLLAFLHTIGACPKALREHAKLAREQRANAHTRLYWLSELDRLRTTYPYTYNLLQAAAAGWVRRTAVRVSLLPHQYTMHQLRAIGTRYGVPLPPHGGLPAVVPLQACRMAVCRVCLQIYSIVRNKRRPRQTRNASKRRKTEHTHGYPDVPVSMDEKGNCTMHCARGRSVAHERCDAQPLVEIDMLGREVSLKGTVYILCPQPGCGHLMPLKMAAIAYTTYGPMCYACAAARQEHEHSGPPAATTAAAEVRRQLLRLKTEGLGSKPAAPVAGPWPLDTEEDGEGAGETKAESKEEKGATKEPARCFLCNKRLTSASHLHLFGMDTYVCDRHNIGLLTQHALSDLNQRGFTCDVSSDALKEDEVRDSLLTWHLQHEEAAGKKRERQAKRDRKQAERNAIVRDRLAR
jgi:hypothetical protein